MINIIANIIGGNPLAGASGGNVTPIPPVVNGFYYSFNGIGVPLLSPDSTDKSIIGSGQYISPKRLTANAIAKIVYNTERYYI